MKQLYLRQFLFCLCLFAGINIFAYDVYQACIDGIYYSFSGNNAIVSCQKVENGNYRSDYSGVVTIPESVTYNDKTYSVTSIGSHAFEWSSVTSITIPNSLKNIGSNAFSFCVNLTSINIPNGVTSIKSGTFSNCRSLIYVDIPESVTSIGNSAFYDCRSLTSIDIPNSVTSIEMNAFMCCSGLTNLTLSNNLKKIEYNCFLGCSSLTSLIIPNSVETIGDQAFYECSGLNFVSIPNSITSIGYSAFKNCSSLTSLTIPDNVKSIGNSAFFGCSSLKRIILSRNLFRIENDTFESCSELSSIIIPDNVTSIGNYAFSSCISLTSVIIGNGVTSIGSSAFNNCTSLTSITIGSSVSSINTHAFSNCSELKKVIVPDIAAWCGIGFMSADSNPLFYAHHLFSDENTEITELIIPYGETGISGSAFLGCNSLTSITIPSSVTSITSYSFSGCSRLSSIHISDLKMWCESSFGVCFPCAYDLYLEGYKIKKLTIPNDVTGIGINAFKNCKSLTSVTIHDGVTSIGEFAFSNCKNITYLIIPNSMTCISERAFEYCTKLTDVYCFAENVPTTSSNTFDNSSIESATLHVPVNSVNSYKMILPWSKFSEIIEISEKCTSPIISYTNGELSFSCETEGADFVTEITDSDIKKYYSAKISLTATYNICVYATKDGYENSDTIQATLCWIDVEPQTDGIVNEDAMTELKAMPVLIQSHDDAICVSGAPECTPINVYDMSGRQIGSSTSINGSAIIKITPKEKIIIVKIGDKAVTVKRV